MKNALFEGDPVFEEQESVAEKYEKQCDLKKFIGYKLLHSCQDCMHQHDGECDVMVKYKQITFPVCDLGKCGKWKQKVE